MRRLLLVKLSACGDVVHSLPTAAALQRAGWRVDWLVEPAAAALVRACPAVERCLVVPRRRGFPFLEPAETTRLARQLRAHRYRAVLDLQGLAKSAVWTAWTGALRCPRVGFAAAREGAPLAYTRRVARRGGAGLAVERYLAAAVCLGAQSGPIEFPLCIPAEAVSQAEKLLRQQGVAGPFALVLPGAGKPANRWLPKRWGAILARLRGRGNAVVLCGADGDAALIRAVRAHAPEARDLCGRTSWLSLAALAQRARLVLGHDSGPVHLAAALGRPCLALFGPASPARTAPWGGWALGARLDCAPCLKRTCPLGYQPPLCQQRLPIEPVWRVVEALLDGRSPALEPGSGLWLRQAPGRLMHAPPGPGAAAW